MSASDVRHKELAGDFLHYWVCGLIEVRQVYCTPKPLILYNLCLSLGDDDVFKEPMRKRRRSLDQRFRAFPPVEQSAFKECECQ